MKVIVDIDGFFDEYMAYCKLFKHHPPQGVRDTYLHNHIDEAMTYGKWFTVIGYGITEETYQCSECRGLVHEKTKYCPHCSALMQPKKEKEVKAKGEWIHLQGYNIIEGKAHRYDNYKCSECGYIKYGKYNKYPICPNCGAKMNMEEE